MPRKFTLLAAAAAILLISGSAMATPDSGIVSREVAAQPPFADPVGLSLCQTDAPALAPPVPCRCPHPTCVLCRSVVGDLDLQALTPPAAPYPCRCPNPKCVLCRSDGGPGFEALTRSPGQAKE